MVFGGDGGDSVYGLWMTQSSTTEPVVVEMGEADDSFAIVGIDLPSFLIGRSAYYLLLYGDDGFQVNAALDALGVPDGLRRYETRPAGSMLNAVGELIGVKEVVNDPYYQLRQWANPGFPDPEADPWTHSMTVQQINAFVSGLGK